MIKYVIYTNLKNNSYDFISVIINKVVKILYHKLI